MHLASNGKKYLLSSFSSVDMKPSVMVNGHNSFIKVEHVQTLKKAAGSTFRPQKYS